MIEKKYKFKIKTCCFALASLIIFSGCSTQTKKDHIVEIQRNRISKLERRVQKQQQMIAKLKTHRWLAKPQKMPVSAALNPLRKHLKKRQWVSALKLSSRLKTRYPKSVELAKMRALIFKKMGLKKQANNERMLIKNLRARRN